MRLDRLLDSRDSALISCFFFAHEVHDFYRILRPPRALAFRMPVSSDLTLEERRVQRKNQDNKFGLDAFHSLCLPV